MIKSTMNNKNAWKELLKNKHIIMNACKPRNLLVYETRTKEIELGISIVNNAINSDAQQFEMLMNFIRKYSDDLRQNSYNLSAITNDVDELIKVAQSSYEDYQNNKYKDDRLDVLINQMTESNKLLTKLIQHVISISDKMELIASVVDMKNNTGPSKVN